MTQQHEAVRSGHISFEQAEGIEGRRSPEAPGGPRTVEVLGFFGAAALAIATLILTFDVTLGEELADIFLGTIDNVGGGLVSLAGAAVLLAVGVRLTAGDAGAIRRSGGFVLLAGYALASVAFALLLLDLDAGDFTPLIRATPVAVIAVAVWRRAPSVPTQVAIFTAAVQVVGALLILFQLDDPITPASIATSAALGSTPELQSWVSLLIGTGLGLVWIWMGATGPMRPRNAAFALGAVYAWLEAIQLFASDDAWVMLSIVVAAGFAAGALRWRSSVLAGFATVATLALILQVIMVAVDEPSVSTFYLWYGFTGAAALLGALLLQRREASGPAAAAPTERA
ncbi:MAG: hypothetical protein QY307_08615 [Acidimicrobiia bacterium]|nr:MAG: hypothetical protein QY307_08615 [Acidimicrobiia bacterium]